MRKKNMHKAMCTFIKIKKVYVQSYMYIHVPLFLLFSSACVLKSILGSVLTFFELRRLGT